MTQEQKSEYKNPAGDQLKSFLEIGEKLGASIDDQVRIVANQELADNHKTGSISNPIKELTEQHKRGYGWLGNENYMRDELASLSSFAAITCQVEKPQKSCFAMPKNKNRRIDMVFSNVFENMIKTELLLFSPRGRMEKSSNDLVRKSREDVKKLEEIHRGRVNNFLKTIIGIELKSNYISAEDVQNAISTKAYPQILYHGSHQESTNFSGMRSTPRPVVFMLVSPAGITEEASNILKKHQEDFQEEYNGEIRLTSLRLDSFVWNFLYPLIEAAYKDDEGAPIGRQWLYVKNDIESRCKKLMYPEFWLEQQKVVDKEFIKKTIHLPKINENWQ